MKIFIVPATYNEKGNIERLITILEEEVFPKLKQHDMHILVADDDSPDGTAAVVRELMKKYKNLGVDVGPKKGLGAAYLRVLSHAIEKNGAEVVITIDSDLQHDPHDVTKLIEKIEEGYDIVTTTRYSKGGSMPRNWPFYRKVFSIGANTFARVVTGRFFLHDWTGGFRAYKSTVFLKERHKLSSFSGYTFQVAALYKSLLDGYSVTEVPIHFYSRRIGDSKIAPAEYIYNYFKYIVIERVYELKRFIKFLFVGGTGFLLQLVITYIIVHLNVEQFIAAMIGAESAIISNFILNNFWTFHDTKHVKERGHVLYRFFKFNLSTFGAVAIQGIVVYVAVHWLGERIPLFGNQIPTSIIVLVPTIIFIVIPLNYLIYNKIIWKTHHLKKEQ